MAKKAIVTVGFEDYAMSVADATTLMKIAERAKKVEYQGVRKPYLHAQDDEPFAYRMVISETVSKIPESHRITHEKE